MGTPMPKDVMTARKSINHTVVYKNHAAVHKNHSAVYKSHGVTCRTLSSR